MVCTHFKIIYGNPFLEDNFLFFKLFKDLFKKFFKNIHLL